jgi:hypothetical protein
MTESLTIARKCKATPIAVASLADFALTAAGPCDPQVVLQNPHISLYCLDHPQQRALFVELDDGWAAAAAPFLYLAQYERAQRLVAVPYATLAQLADAVATPRRSLALIHSPGRSGSTVLSKAFQRVTVTTSLSEPDVYTQLVQLRAQGLASDQELVALLRWATRLLFKPTFAGGAELWVLKFRSFCIQIADLLVDAFPAVRNIFLYRDLRPWLLSSARAFFPSLPPEGTPALQLVAASVADFIPLLRAYLAKPGAQVAPIELLALLWLSVLRRYDEVERQGIRMHAIRYEALAQEPQRVLGDVFQHVGLPASAVGAAAAALSRDAQEGTFLAREAVGWQEETLIAERQWAQVRALCARYPVGQGVQRAGAHGLISSAV